jgi:hypothetical protein
MAKLVVRKKPLYDEESRTPIVRRRETKVSGGTIVEEWTKTGYSRMFLSKVREAPK